jgi:hypothetical protein
MERRAARSPSGFAALWGATAPGAPRGGVARPA